MKENNYLANCISNSQYDYESSNIICKFITFSKSGEPKYYITYKDVWGNIVDREISTESYYLIPSYFEKSIKGDSNE